MTQFTESAVPPMRAGPRLRWRGLLGRFLLALALLWPHLAAAHHVLGRPSYSLNEDSNTPSSMQGEVLIGDFTVTYMVFPAFPKPGAQGRVNVHVSRNNDAAPFEGELTFTVQDDPWFSWLGMKGAEEPLGVQKLDDGVFRQGFVFSDEGDYFVSVKFKDAGAPYTIDIPLRVGAPPALGPIGLAVGALFIVLLGVTLIQRRRSMTGKLRDARAPRATQEPS